MNLTIFSYHDLFKSNKKNSANVQQSLLQNGIIGIRGIPSFLEKSDHFIAAARRFKQLDDRIKEKYCPNRDLGDTLGYEIGAEQFKDLNGLWQIDTNKASYYALVPEHHQNKWPAEIDLKIPFLELGELIFETGKFLLNYIGLNNKCGLNHELLTGCGRMLHYHGKNINMTPNWCGAHFDHGLFTGLIPAHYFRDVEEINEPEEAGLYVMPSNGTNFEKVHCEDKSILLFQVGEFAQILTHDRIKATQHLVKKANTDIERFTFALFFSPDMKMIVKSDSILNKDERYKKNHYADGHICFEKWHIASFEKYRA